LGPALRDLRQLLGRRQGGQLAAAVGVVAVQAFDGHPGGVLPHPAWVAGLHGRSISGHDSGGEQLVAEGLWRALDARLGEGLLGHEVDYLEFEGGGVGGELGAREGREGERLVDEVGVGGFVQVTDLTELSQVIAAKSKKGQLERKGVHFHALKDSTFYV